MIRATYHAQSLNLVREDGTASIRRVLDIGTGAGFFPFTARYLGHDAESIDVCDDPLYGELTELLGVYRKIHRVRIENPLPDFEQKFDLITAFQLVFDRDPALPGGAWGPSEWASFLNYVRTNHLTENGSVFLGLNSGLTNEHLKSLDDLYNKVGAEKHTNGYHITFDNVQHVGDIIH